MTHIEFNETLHNIPNEDLIKKASEAVSKLCNTGAKSFTMSIPPRLDDTDIVLSEVIRRLQSLTAKDKSLEVCSNTEKSKINFLGGLTEEEYTERELLLDLQRNKKHLVTHDEFKRLQELSRKLYRNENQLTLKTLTYSHYTAIAQLANPQVTWKIVIGNRLWNGIDLVDINSQRPEESFHIFQIDFRDKKERENSNIFRLYEKLSGDLIEIAFDQAPIFEYLSAIKCKI